MPEDWQSTANEVAVALGEVGYVVTLHKPSAATGPEWDPVYGATIDHPMTVVDGMIRIRDAETGAYGRARRVLTVSATGPIPAKGDKVTVRGETHGIEEVMPLAPGGVDLVFDLVLEGEV